MNTAIGSHDLETIGRLLQENKSVLEKGYFKYFSVLNSLLLEAAVNGHIDIMEMLLAFGADIDASQHPTVEPEGVVKQMFFKGDSRLSVVKWLLSRGAMINHARNGVQTSTSLINAAIEGAFQGVQLLVEHGAAINCLTHRGQTPLDIAIMYGHKEVADYLRSVGALEAWQVKGEAPPTPPPVPRTLSEHLATILGKVDPLSLQQIIPSGLPVAILRVVKDGEQFLITDGMAAKPMTVPEGQEAANLRYAEVMIRLPKKWR